MKKLAVKLVAFFYVLICISCNGEQVENPKPRAFPKVVFPERNIEKFSSEECPFTFQYMDYAVIEKKETFFDEKPLSPCWFDLSLPDFNGRIHVSYIEIDSPKHFDKLVADAFKLSGKHNVKANYIDEMKFKNENNASGVIFNLEGPVASPFQFYMTDSTDHFLRGSLYLNTQVRPDSLAPIYDFLKKDITLILNTLEWEK